MKKETKDFYSNGLFIYSSKAPFVIGKIVKIEDDEQAMDYEVKQVDYCIAQVEGYKVFIVYAGFSTKPTKQIQSHEITQALNTMCEWYKENKLIGNKSANKRFKLNTPCNSNQ